VTFHMVIADKYWNDSTLKRELEVSIVTE